jgi:hypothetical protein
MTVFWNVAPSSLVDTDLALSGHSYIYHKLFAWGFLITLIMEALSFSETSVSVYQTKRCFILEDRALFMVKIPL